MIKEMMLKAYCITKCSCLDKIDSKIIDFKNHAIKHINAVVAYYAGPLIFFFVKDN